MQENTYVPSCFNRGHPLESVSYASWAFPLWFFKYVCKEAHKTTNKTHHDDSSRQQQVVCEMRRERERTGRASSPGIGSGARGSLH